MSQYTISFSRGKTSKKQKQAEMEDGKGKKTTLISGYIWPTDDLTASYTVYSIVRKIIISLILSKYG